MKIGYVVKRYPRYSETFIVNEILAHERAGLDIEIFALLPPEDTHFQNQLSSVRAPVTYLQKNVWKASEFWTRLQRGLNNAIGGYSALEDARGMELRDVAQAFELSLLLRDRKITHVHAHFATASTSVARFASILSGIPYSFTAHAKDIFHEDVDREFLRKKFRDAAASITVSDFNVKTLAAEFGADAATLKRVYNGLDLRRFSYSEPAAESRQILAVGRLVEKKGFADLISACAILRNHDVEYMCQIVGSGEVAFELEQQIAALSLSDNVRLLGARPQSEVIRLLREAAVFAAPCKIGADGNRDGLPTVLLEAMALGTPCISTRVTGIPEAVLADETGSIVDDGDVSGLVRAITKVLSSPDIRRRYSTAARRHIERNFDIDSNAAELREIFHAIHSERWRPPLEVVS